eukprot:TRINITY_DN9372_c1_g1_i1.p1 TRINITY_DN9372_c1_g1~~TRINITY_DN9372_c1_g1_i1.p1  ORF type:complete len:335 (+),score=15.29 TRINITY_DN9372_c1_g1_i1:65-1006(+)
MMALWKCLALWLLLWASGTHSKVHRCEDAVQLDITDMRNYCSEQYLSQTLKPGDYCLIKPERVHPTQVFVGKVEMECTKSYIQSLSSADLKALLVDNMAPTVIGPGPEFYITDHHHFAVALFQAFLDFERPSLHRVLYACIQADYSALNSTLFWRKMEQQRYVFLEDEHGEKITVNQLPDNLKLMADNPYRTFASWLRKGFAYVKCGTKKTAKLPQCKNESAPFFLECLWGDHLRARFPIDHYPSIPDVRPPLKDFIYRASLQLQTEAMMSLLEEAVAFAVSPASQGMPGFNLAQDKVPPHAVPLDRHGCPMD